MRRPLITLGIALLALATLGLVASRRASTRADFSFINRGDLTTLDLSRMSWAQDLRVAAMLFEPLVRNDLFTHTYAKVPGVAERWETSADGLTWTFHLRPDARWSNGQPVVAGDFVYAFRRGMLPDTAGDYVKLFHLIAGGKAFTTWRDEALARFAAEGQGQPRPAEAQRLYEQTLAKFDELVALKAVDDRTLVLTTERPVPYMLDVLAFEVMAPLYPELLDAHQVIDPITARVNTRYDWTRPDRLVSNGPYTLAAWRFKRDVRLEKNPHYWDAGSIHMQTVNIPSVEDRNATVLAYQAGSVDWVSDVTADYRGDLLEAKRQYIREHQQRYNALVAQGLDQFAIDRRMPRDSRQNIHAVPAFGTYFYNFNCQAKLPDGRDNPFVDARVRRAFAMAMDRDNIAKNIRRMDERTASVLIPPGSLPGYASPAGITYDPEGARKLLAEAGYPGGKGMPTVDILFNRDAGHDVIAQAVASDWERNLGVSVSLRQREIKVFRNDLKQKNYMISRAAWFGDYGDPLTFLDLNRTGDGNNDRGFSYKPYDDLLEAADAELDADKRYDILSQAEKMVIEEQAPMIPIFHYNQVYLFDPHVLSGISPHPRQKQYLFLVDKLDPAAEPTKALEMPARPPGAVK